MDAITVGWLLTGFGWCITGAGWTIVNMQANDRETRKEYRLALSGVEGTLDRLLAAYRSYLSNGNAQALEQSRLQVHSELNKVRRQIEWLEPATGGSLTKHYAKLYEAVTGGDFESKTRGGESSVNNYSRAVTAVEGLLESTEDWFRKTYH